MVEAIMQGLCDEFRKLGYVANIQHFQHHLLPTTVEVRYGTGKAIISMDHDDDEVEVITAASTLLSDDTIKLADPNCVGKIIDKVIREIA